MSWLDGYIGDRINSIEKNYQRSLRRAKLLDAWCVGLWQFTQIGISSLVLYLYFSFEDQSHKEQEINQVTVIYLFQMLTFPINGISWNIAGLRSAKQSIGELEEWERNGKVSIKKKGSLENLSFEFEAQQIKKKVQPGLIYAVSA